MYLFSHLGLYMQRDGQISLCSSFGIFPVGSSHLGLCDINGPFWAFPFCQAHLGNSCYEVPFGHSLVKIPVRHSFCAKPGWALNLFN